MSPEPARPSPAVLAGIGCVSAAVLMVELALTRIFSVTMYYHFAFLAVSIAMFGLSASSVLVYVSPRWHPPERALASLRRYATLFSRVATVGAGIYAVAWLIGLVMARTVAPCRAGAFLEYP